MTSARLSTWRPRAHYPSHPWIWAASNLDDVPHPRRGRGRGRRLVESSATARSARRFAAPDRTRALLEATERIVVATGIVNVWAYEPGDLAAECAAEPRLPGRLLLGIGVAIPRRRPIRGADGQDDVVPRRGSTPRRSRSRPGTACSPRSVPDVAPSAAAGDRRDPVLHDGRPHPLRPRAAGAGRCSLPRWRASSTPPGAPASARGPMRALWAAQYTNNRVASASPTTTSPTAGRAAARRSSRRASPDAIAGRRPRPPDAGADHVCVQPVDGTGIPRDEWTALAAALAD
jgi:hypothetical protein